MRIPEALAHVGTRIQQASVLYGEDQRGGIFLCRKALVRSAEHIHIAADYDRSLSVRIFCGCAQQICGFGAGERLLFDIDAGKRRIIKILL